MAIECSECERDARAGHDKSCSRYVDQIIDTMARRVLAGLVDDAEWENYPDIGEHDWDRVVRRMRLIAPYPDDQESREAYEFLALYGRGGGI